MEKSLYLRAQETAAKMDMSFAAYAIDLIARDLARDPANHDIPAVRRVLNLQLGVVGKAADPSMGEDIPEVARAIRNQPRELKKALAGDPTLNEERGKYLARQLFRKPSKKAS